MSTIAAALLEIVKISIPALIVYFTVQAILKEYLQKQLQREQILLKGRQLEQTLPLKLQAYERLALFCDRIAIPNLILRLRTPDMTNVQLRTAILIAINQEYEHNITQQIYVSEQLWNIIQFARDEVAGIVAGVAESVSPDGDAKELAKALNDYIASSEININLKAQSAIRTELAAFIP